MAVVYESRANLIVFCGAKTQSVADSRSTASAFRRAREQLAGVGATPKTAAAQYAVDAAMATPLPRSHPCKPANSGNAHADTNCRVSGITRRRRTTEGRKRCCGYGGHGTWRENRVAGFRPMQAAAVPIYMSYRPVRRVAVMFQAGCEE